MVLSAFLWSWWGLVSLGIDDEIVVKFFQQGVWKLPVVHERFRFFPRNLLLYFQRQGAKDGDPFRIWLF